MNIAGLSLMSLDAATRLERRVERAYAAFLGALPERWIEDSNLTGFFPKWENLDCYQRDAWRVAIASLEDE